MNTPLNNDVDQLLRSNPQLTDELNICMYVCICVRARVRAALLQLSRGLGLFHRGGRVTLPALINY